jgi:hypothetical protein
LFVPVKGADTGVYWAGIASHAGMLVRSRYNIVRARYRSANATIMAPSFAMRRDAVDPESRLQRESNTAGIRGKDGIIGRRLVDS